MSKIEVEGKKYRVIEVLPYHQAGMPARFVETPNGERVAVKRGGKWTWWTAKDRIGHGSRIVGQ
jgi:hypothetical protein